MSRPLATGPLFTTVGLAAGVCALVVVLEVLVVPFPQQRPRTAFSRSVDAGPTLLDAAPAPRPARRPNIVLFSIDTVRADHLSAYGYTRATSPSLAALAAEGTRFDRAYSAASSTIPSLTSVLTGVLPIEHGMRRATIDDAGQATLPSISPDLPGLVPALHDAGYRTIGVVAHAELREGHGFDRGFDRFVNLGFADVGAVRTAVQAELAALPEDGTPFFLWVHVFEPHAPLVAQPFVDTFWPANLRRCEGLSLVLFPELYGSALFFERDPHCFQYLVALYDGEIRAADDYLGELRAALPPDDLAMIVLADHGEEFLDHGHFGHGHTAYEEVIRVPLVVRLPEGFAALRDQHAEMPVSLLDVLPTVLDVAGIETPLGAVGRSLLPALRGEPLPDRSVYAEAVQFVDIGTVIEPRFSYVAHEEGEPHGLLFDRTTDPGQHVSVHELFPIEAARLDEALRRTIDEGRRRAPNPTDQRLPPELVEQLRALGYVQ